MARYSTIAASYAEAVGDDLDDAPSRALLELLGDVRGRRVLDAGCGSGRLTRRLAELGADVLGVDLSPELLAFARSAGHDGDFRVADLSSPETLAGERFDLVASHFALTDVDDLEGAVATVARVLGPGGAFVFSILHPCFPGAGNDSPSSWSPDRGYHDEGWWRASNSGFRGAAGSNHRTLATYLNTLADSGLQVERMAEPQAAGDWVERTPDAARLPAFLVVRCRRSA